MNVQALKPLPQELNQHEEKETEKDAKKSWNIKKDIYFNKINGPVYMMIGLDNIWRHVLAEIVVYPSEDFGIWKTKLGWMIGRKIPTIQLREGHEDLAKNSEVYY